MADPTADVDRFLAALDHPRKAEIEAVRALILRATPGITEHIKWNAPSFCYRGEDRVTMQLAPGGRLQLVFHRGVTPQETAGFRFEDPGGLLEWAAPDRALVTLRDQADVEAKAAALLEVVDRWVRATT